MSDETTLLPCPFCGSEARMLGTKERWFNPACSNSECGCEWTDSYVTEAEAIAAWNTRATHYKLCTVLDVEYEVKMDALLCRLTNGKWSKSRAYSLDFMVSCVDEEYETLHAKELAELGSGTCEMTRVKEFPEYEDCIFECWTCSACGRSNNEHNPKFCPNCGKRIRKAVER